MHPKFEIGQKVFIPELNEHGVIGNKSSCFNGFKQNSYVVHINEDDEGMWFLEREICESLSDPVAESTPAANAKGKRRRCLPSA